MAAASYYAEAENVKMNLIRTREDKWNMLYIFPPPAPGTTPQPQTFKGKLNIHSMTLFFSDYKGWGQTPLKNPFREIFQNMRGNIDFHDLHRARLRLDGLVSSNGKPIRLDGHFNTTNGQYALHFQLVPDLNTWGRYIFPFKGFLLSGVSPLVSGELISKNPFPKDHIPFWYSVNIPVNHFSFKTPFFASPIKNIHGHVKMAHGILTRSDVKGILNASPGLSEDKLWDSLVKSHILSREGQIQNSIPLTEETIAKRLPEPYLPFKDKLLRLLTIPPSTLIVEHFKGALNTIPLSGKGVMFLEKGTLAFNIRSGNFPIPKGLELFPAIEKWKISGMTHTSFALKGKIENPSILGNLWSDSPTIYGIHPKKNMLTYHLFNKKLSFSIQKSELYDGLITGDGTADFSIRPVFFSAKLIGKHVKAGQNGGFHFSSLVQGIPTEYVVDFQIHSSNLSFYNQYIQSASGVFKIHNVRDIDIENTTLAINKTDSLLHLSGRITDFKTLGLSFSAKDLAFYDVAPNRTPNPADVPGSATIQGSLSGNFSWPLSPHSFHGMLLSLSGSLSHYALWRHPIDTASFDLEYKNGLLDIKKCLARHKEEHLALKGTFVNGKPNSLECVVNSIDLTHSPFIQDKIKSSWKPFGGIVSFSAKVSPVLFPSPSETPSKNTFPLHQISPYHIQTHGELTHALFQNQPLGKVQWEGMWDGHTFHIQTFSLKHVLSTVLLSGRISAKKELDILLQEGSLVYLDDFQVLSAPFGRFSGKIKADGQIKGTVSKPHFQGRFSCSDFVSTFLKIESAQGQVGYQNGRLSFSPLLIKNKEDNVSISGNIHLAPLLSQNEFRLSDLDYDIHLIIEKGNLDSLSELLEGLYKESKYRSGKKFGLAPEVIVNANISVNPSSKEHFKIISPYQGSSIPIYRTAGQDTFLHFFDTLLQQKMKKDSPEELGLKSILKGSLTGYLKARSQREDSPALHSQFQFGNSEISFLKSENIALSLHSQTNRSIAIDLSIANGNIGGQTFKKILSKGVFTPETDLIISKMDIETESRYNENVMKGKIPLGGFWDISKRNNPMNLSLKLTGDDIGAFSIFSPFIQKITNNGIIELNLTGSLEKPVWNSTRFELKNARLLLTRETIFQSPFSLTTDQIFIQNNQVVIPKTAIHWQGADTKGLNQSDHPNTFMTWGTIDIHKLNFISPRVLEFNLNLKTEDTVLLVSFPTLYSGQIDLKDLAIKGGYVIPLSKEEKSLFKERQGTPMEEGPVITGRMILRKGEIVLPTISQKKPRPSFLLGLQCDIRENVSVEGSMFGEGVLQGLANVFTLDLKETVSSLEIGGSLNLPQIGNKIRFSRGTIHFLNRSFELMNEEKQKVFFPNQPEKFRDNSVAFFTQTLPNIPNPRLVPIFDMNAVTLIEKTSTPNVNSNSTAIVFSLKGPLYNLENIVFEEYQLSDPKTPQYMKSYSVGSPSGADENSLYQVIKILMPDLFNNPEFSQKGLETDESKRLIRELSENRINSLIRKEFLRPVERTLAQTIGVQDLRVDYNIGGALLQGVGDIVGYQGLGRTQGTVGVDVITQLFSEQLYLRVKTNVDIKTEERGLLDHLRLSEVELTYYLLRHFSLNYSTIQNEKREYKPKLSLKYTYEF